MTKFKSAIVAAVVWAIAAVMLLIFGLTLPKTNAGEKTVTLEIKYENATYRYEELTTDGEFVIDLLKQYDELLELGFKYEESTYGAFITELKGTPNDDAEGIYYGYTVNGEYANYGISQQPVADGDEITFSYEKTTYDESWSVVGKELKPGGNSTVTATPDNESKNTYIIVAAACAVIAAASLIVAFVKSK